MTYTIGQTAKKIGVAPSTLRYYDREGLLPFAQRSENEMRIFNDSDLEWLRVICCLKKTGMKLDDIRTFIEMAMSGDETAQPRLKLIIEQKESVKARIKELEETLLMLEFKEWYYETAVRCGSTSVPKNMPLSDIPERFRSVRIKLKGE